VSPASAPGGASEELSAEELLTLAAALAGPGEPGFKHAWWDPEAILERLTDVVWKLCPEFADDVAARDFALRFMAAVATLPGGLDGVRKLLADEMRAKAEWDGDAAPLAEGHAL
jgi:hypothetical protein